MATLIETGGTTWGVVAMFAPLAIGVFILGSAAFGSRVSVEDDGSD